VGALALVAVAADRPHDRSDWLPRWSDADGDCQDTRQEVLLRDVKRPQNPFASDNGTVGDTLELSPDGCRVVQGAWLEPYEGRGRLVTDPRELEIDHLVPLGYAHRHGGGAWPLARKRAYANWLAYRHALLAVSASANRAKGDRGPSEWVPDNLAMWCRYGEAWAVVVTVWKLDLPEADREAIRKLVETC
jgi:hypothetical protein